jgi:hypothetical protein
MKRLLETSLGTDDDTWFSVDGKRVSDEDALRKIKEQCNPYKTGIDRGVLVHISEEQYRNIQRAK